MSPSRRLSDLVEAGRDYEAKVKIIEVLDHEVMVMGVDHVIIMKEVKLADGSKTEVEDANYYNVRVDDAGVLKTFSTGAQPIVKVLVALERLEKTGVEVFPFMAVFHKEGQTYIVADE